jgi:oligosaccharide reducing-end xylanase
MYLRYGNQYSLTGQQLDGDHSPGLVAMNAVSLATTYYILLACRFRGFQVGVLASDQNSSWAFIDELWDTPVPSGQWRYYDGSLYLEAFLILSGQYRAWMPNQKLERL